MFCGQNYDGNVRVQVGEWSDTVKRLNLALDFDLPLMSYADYF